jgi:hypothetical protein
MVSRFDERRNLFADSSAERNLCSCWFAFWSRHARFVLISLPNKMLSPRTL